MILRSADDIFLNGAACYLDYAFLVAAKKGHYEIIKLLLSKGAISYVDAMLNACTYNHIEIVKLLIKQDIENCPQHFFPKKNKIDILKECWIKHVRMVI